MYISIDYEICAIKIDREHESNAGLYLKLRNNKGRKYKFK